MSLPTYTPELARELRGDRTQQQMCDLVGLSRRDQWSAIESGKEPGAQTWMLALIVGDMHPDYGPRSKASRRPRATHAAGPA